MISIFLYTPFLLQALCMLFDEFYFHRKRGLGWWEKIGHPLDTLTVITCYFFIFFSDYSMNNVLIFSSLSFFSSLFVTKDEFVHSELCEPKENWLHAILFILHPITFLCAGIIWKSEGKENLFILGQIIILFIVLIYQILYWSIPWKKRTSTIK
jgi:hypothetical protein